MGGRGGASENLGRGFLTVFEAGPAPPVQSLPAKAWAALAAPPKAQLGKAQEIEKHPPPAAFEGCT